MIAKLAARGTSFKGAGNYYLHDKEAQTSERVAWIETINLRTANPERALKVMAGTAMDRDAIKEAAGISASGRSSDRVVQTYSLSWHLEEQPTKAEMLAAARESLEVLGIEDRQALILCHNDEPHPHIHIIVNRVSPADGRLSSTSQEKLKLSRWAEDWERRGGKVYCEQRVANNAEREQGRFVKDRSGVSRSTFDAAQAALEGFNDNRDAQQAATELKADQRRKAAELASIGRDMHAHYRTELANLGADYQRDKARLKATHDAEKNELWADIRQIMREAMCGLGEAQRREQRTVTWREKSLLGRLWNAYDAGGAAESASGRIGRTLWGAISRSARLDGLRQSRTAQRQAAYNDLKAWARDRDAELRDRYTKEFKATYQRFQVARTSTLQQYDQEQKEYRRRWAERNQTGRGAWQTFKAKYQPLEREQQRYARQQENLRRIEGRWAQDRGQQAETRRPRDRGAGRDR